MTDLSMPKKISSLDRQDMLDAITDTTLKEYTAKAIDAFNNDSMQLLLFNLINRNNYYRNQLSSFVENGYVLENRRVMKELQYNIRLLNDLIEQFSNINSIIESYKEYEQR